MKYISIIVLIFLFLKTIYYGSFELKIKKNKLAGFGVYFLASIGLFLPFLVIFIWY